MWSDTVVGATDGSTPRMVGVPFGDAASVSSWQKMQRARISLFVGEATLANMRLFGRVPTK
jgi:hypothetical protein